MRTLVMYIVAGCSCIVIALVGVALLTSPMTPVTPTQQQTAPKPNFALNLLSLLPLAPSQSRESPVIAAMIENHEDARPYQKGLSEADVVFELIVEGDITRFMALFHEHGLPENIGPVRSLRPHFISIAEAYHALVLHAGASTIAYENLDHRTTITNHDGILHDGETYERDRSIDPPHNLFMPREKLLPLIEEKRHRLKTAMFPLFERSNSVPEGGKDAKKFSIDFGSETHNVTFAYSGWENAYNRSTGGAESQASPENVLILEAYIDGYGRPGTIPWTQTFGGGDMLLFRNGKVFEGRWSRKKDKPFEFFNENGDTLPLARGQVWITMVPRLSMVKHAVKAAALDSPETPPPLSSLTSSAA